MLIFKTVAVCFKEYVDFIPETDSTVVFLLLISPFLPSLE